MRVLSNASPVTMVASNGTRKTKTDHSKPPLSIEEVREEARSYAATGANVLHLHVLEDDGDPTLDRDRYCDAIIELSSAQKEFPLPIATESARLYDLAAIRPSFLATRSSVMVGTWGRSKHGALCVPVAKDVQVCVGFQSNLIEPDGHLANSNASNVACLPSALAVDQVESGYQ